MARYSGSQNDRPFGPQSALDAAPQLRRVPMRFVREQRDLISGALILCVGVLALHVGAELAGGQAARIGPGYVPRLVSWALVASGSALVLRSLTGKRVRLAGWALRPSLLVLGSALLFAVTIEPLGWFVACTLAVGVASAAAPDFQPIESVVAAIALAAFTAILFVMGLGMAFSIWPRVLV
jgi:hypothetical protein